MVFCKLRGSRLIFVFIGVVPMVVFPSVFLSFFEIYLALRLHHGVHMVANFVQIVHLNDTFHAVSSDLKSLLILRDNFIHSLFVSFTSFGLRVIYLICVC
jgi:hypothetical protein